MHFTKGVLYEYKYLSSPTTPNDLLLFCTLWFWKDPANSSAGLWSRAEKLESADSDANAKFDRQDD
jgi:hypothetical protein